MIAGALALAVAATLAAAQPAVQVIPAGWQTGNCVSGRLTFDPKRIFALPLGQAGQNQRFNVDRSKFDFTLDYGSVDYGAGNTVNLNLVPAATAGNPANGARLSTTMYLRYGKITGRFTPLSE
eukprot:jgi/Hompol1/4181/HPOL_006973-RA